MDLSYVEKIADSVLYEGYMLYPYRASSVKNRQRFNWGALVPGAYSIAQRGTEACEMQTECLLIGDANSELEVIVRFLHLTDREIGKVDHPTHRVTDEYESVQTLDIDGQLCQSWQEAVERSVGVSGLHAGDLSKTVPFMFPMKREVEAIEDRSGKVAGLIVRKQAELNGEIKIEITHLADKGLSKVNVRIRNTTPFSNAGAATRDEALLRSLVSTHVILGAKGGDFISLLEPAQEHAYAAALCENRGAFPILVGKCGERNCMLASPIILYDYPEIAPESPGDLFDSTEIDEILTLRILTMTDQEKREMRAIDDRARKVLERTELMSENELLNMHGTLRGMERSKQANG